ncbi:MAG: DUF697 domain-containing protein [Leptospiraceae bacterium]|nr:DUF697 domain-containing protein [Leptospiraceae bacterium]MCP5493160.1 DUF697 domain-containing protein [Leptospiraceae bacterium]
MEESQETDIKREEPDSIIKTHILLGMTAGAIPIPIADILAITVIQLDMIRKLANYYEVDYDNEWGKSVISSLAGSSLAIFGGSTIARYSVSGLKAVPGLGTLIGITAQILLAGASTYALGEIFKEHFSGKGTMFNFNLDGVKERYKNFYEKGKKVASKMYETSKLDDIYAQIEKLSKLKDIGAISREEYEEGKRKLLDKI